MICVPSGYTPLNKKQSNKQTRKQTNTCTRPLIVFVASARCAANECLSPYTHTHTHTHTHTPKKYLAAHRVLNAQNRRDGRVLVAQRMNAFLHLLGGEVRALHTNGEN